MGLGLLARSSVVSLAAVLAACGTSQQFSSMYSGARAGGEPAATMMDYDAFYAATGAKLRSEPSTIQQSTDTVAAKIAEELLLHQRLSKITEVDVPAADEKLRCEYKGKLPIAGLWCQGNDVRRIVIRPGQAVAVSIHEVAHNEARWAFTNDSTTLKKLKDIATDEAGNSLYLTKEEVQFYFDDEKYKIPVWKRNSTRNRAMGFVDLHARLSPDEDAASFLTAARQYDQQFAREITGENPNEPLQQRALLWIEAGVLPQEFLEYKTLEAMTGSRADSTSARNDLRAYDKGAHEFLQRNPHSEYIPRVQLQRARIAVHEGDAESAVQHYIYGIHMAHELQHVEFGIYNHLLREAGAALYKVKSEYAARMFTAAAAQYEMRRVTEADIALHGVQDFLAASDLLYCNLENLLKHDETRELLCSAKMFALKEQ